MQSKLPAVSIIRRNRLLHSLHHVFIYSSLIAALATSPLQHAYAQAPAAQAQQTFSFAIPAGPLDAALAQFAQTTGLFFSGSGTLTKGKNSQALQGSYSLAQALDLLLLGSGIGYRQETQNSITLIAAPQSNGPLLLAPIKVRGELLERSVQDSQTSVAVITGDEIESRSSDDLGDFLQREAGVNVAGGIVSIRGINAAGAAGLGTGGLITTTVDGVRVSRVANQSSMEYSTWDLEQIEVLRGPQSTQNGLNSLAGSVVVNSKDPVHDQEGKIRIGAGNGSEREGALAFNTPIIQDVLAVRFSTEAIRSDGFIDNPILGIDDVDSLEREVYRLGLLFEPTDSWTSILKLSYNDSEYGSNTVDSATFPGSRSKAQLTEDTRTKEVFSANWENTFVLTDTLSLETSTSYSDFDIFTQFEGLFGSFLIVNGAREFDQELIDQEVRLHYEDDNGVRAVAGVFYSETDIKNRSLAILAAPFTAPFDIQLGGVTIPAGFTAPAGFSLADLTSFSDQENYALFGEVEFPITETLRGVIGGRYDDSKFGDQQSDAFVPKMGIVYQIDSQKSIGFTYQEGFREGGERTYVVTDSSSGSPVDREVVVPFDPQFSKNHEIAFRSELFDGNLLLNANIFYTKWEDMQVRELVQSNDPNVIPQFGASVTTNAAESSLWGGEVDLRARVSDNLEVYSSAAYVETEFDDYITTVGDMTIDLSGNQFRSAPQWSGNLGAIYDYADGWQLGIDINYTDSTFSEAENLASLENDAYWLVDVRLARNFGNGLVITAYAENLFDEDYTTNRNPATDFVAVARDNVGPPLTYGIFAQYEF